MIRPLDLPGTTTLSPTGRRPGTGGRSRAASWRRGARLSATAAASVLALVLTGCSSGSAAGGSATPQPQAGRWWSNGAAAVGSNVDASDPTAAAARLRPSQKDYCGMLAETMKSGRSVLPGAGGSGSVATLRAFVAEIQQVAPAEVSGAWRVLGPALVGFASSQGSSLGTSSADATSLSLAAQRISAHAAKVCHVDLAQAPAR